MYNKTLLNNNAAPYIDATNLNKIEVGVDEAHTDVATLQADAWNDWQGFSVIEDGSAVVTNDRIFADTVGGVETMAEISIVGHDGSATEFNADSATVVDVRGEGPLAVHEVARAALDDRLATQRVGRCALRVEVPDQGAPAALRGEEAEVHRGRRLAHAALDVEDREHSHGAPPGEKSRAKVSRFSGEAKRWKRFAKRLRSVACPPSR